jgi:hypothetical protein
MLAPLSAGKHSLHIHGSFLWDATDPGSAFTLDVAYEITVGKTK